MHFFAGLSSAASVVFTLYLLSHDVSQQQIGILFGFFMICLAILDIPTGAVADMFGHKVSIIVGLLFQALSFLIFFLFPNFLGFFAGMFVSALGLAFQSGAISSLIYEILHKEGLHENFQKAYGHANGYFLTASIIASPIGSLVYSMYPRAPYFLAFLFFILAALSLSFVKWEFTKKSLSMGTYFKTMGNGIKATLNSQILIALVIIGIGLTVNRLVFNQNISQPYLVSAGVDVAYIGFVAAVFSGVLAFASINAHKVSKKLGQSYSLLLVIGLPSLSVIALSFINNIIALPIIALMLMGHAFREPVLTHMSQENIDADKRSTMASTISFLISIAAGIMLPFWGKGIDTIGIHGTLLFLGVFTFVVGMFGLILYQRNTKALLSSLKLKINQDDSVNKTPRSSS